jgi:hypothetical protein
VPLFARAALWFLALAGMANAIAHPVLALAPADTSPASLERCRSGWRRCPCGTARRR